MGVYSELRKSQWYFGPFPGPEWNQHNYVTLFRNMSPPLSKFPSDLPNITQQQTVVTSYIYFHS